LLEKLDTDAGMEHKDTYILILNCIVDVVDVPCMLALVVVAATAAVVEEEGRDT
jgi:hypothetical protein